MLIAKNLLTREASYKGFRYAQVKFRSAFTLNLQRFANFSARAAFFGPASSKSLRQSDRISKWSVSKNP